MHALVDRIERWVDPVDDDEEPMLAALAAFGSACDRDEGARSESTGELPRAWIAEFAKRGLARAMAPNDVGGTLSWPRLMRLTARLSAWDVDFALVLGGAVLGGLPVLVAGSDAQRRAYFGAVLNGELGGLALSEWAHGSDLLANDLVATRIDDGTFELTGEKGPVNNGGVGAFVVTLARTRPEHDPFAQSLFLVPREAITSRERFATVGHRNMDLARIRFDHVQIARDAIIGELGDGFAIVRRALTVSRSGVAAQALGPLIASLEKMREHASARRIYGADLHALGGVRALLADAFARAVVATALVRRAARTVACFGSGAAGWTSAAKYLAPVLMEEVVRDATTLLGARAMMEDGSFSRIRRAAPVFAIFDGSSQLQLDELWRHALGWREGTADRTLLRTVEGPFALRDEPRVDRALVTPVVRGALAEVAAKLPGWAAAHRDGEQSTRFSISHATAIVYALGAAHESSTPEVVIAARCFLAMVAPSLAATALSLGDEPLAHRLLALSKDRAAARADAYAAASGP